jgi:hypothetical protein
LKFEIALDEQRGLAAVLRQYAALDVFDDVAAERAIEVPKGAQDLQEFDVAHELDALVSS